MSEATALTTVTQALSTSDFQKTQKELLSFVKSQLKEAKSIKDGDLGDYGIIPGTKKKTLLKPGAEKLAKLFGLVPSYEQLKEIEDFDKGILFYKYRCTLTHFTTGRMAGQAVRSSNNKERQFLVQGKNAFELANAVEAKAQKRALVAAVVQATMASEIFDADSSEFDDEAPGKAVTKEEDPKRVAVSRALYGAAKEYGWNETWIHAAIKQKWDKDSLKDISNEQMEQLREFIVTRYLPVAAGEKPKLRDEDKVGESKQEEAEKKSEAVEGEIVKEAVYYCQGKKHQTGNDEDRVRVPVGEFCSKECEISYWGKPKTKEDEKKRKSEQAVKQAKERNKE